MVARTLHTPTDQCTWESVAEEESALCRHGTAVSSPCAPLCAIGAYIPASEQGQGGVACSMVPGRATATGGTVQMLISSCTRRVRAAPQIRNITQVCDRVGDPG